MTRTFAERAGRLEQFSWAMYDFASAGYTTVVLTTVYNAFFVAVVAAGAGLNPATGTLLWTATVALGNAIVLVTAPVLGALADARAAKKRLLLFASVGCIAATALLARIGPGEVVSATLLVAVSLVCFESGVNLVSAFLPELVPTAQIGRMSGLGWGLGYLGGLATLALCLAYVSAAQARGEPETTFVPMTLLITAAVYGSASLPTFAFVRERAVPPTPATGSSLLRTAFARAVATLRQVRARRDLFRFLVALVVFQSGVNTVIVVTAIYARSQFELGQRELLLLLMIVHLAAAAGSIVAGHLQDRFGAVRTLNFALVVWIVALALVASAASSTQLRVAAIVAGVALGGSQSGGRAIVALFTPPARTAEFFGLWGVANRAASIVGPLTYGFIGAVAGERQRAAVGVTMLFFVAGLALLRSVDERRGIAMAGDGRS